MWLDNYDPLGILSLKLFLQELTQAELDWDQPLTKSLLERWKALVLSLQNSPSISVPRVYLWDERKPDTYQLCGFCNASISSYAAVVYLVISIGVERYVQFVASRTRVASKVTQTIPRLELIGALLLLVCYCDSRVARYWIYGLDRDWKSFIQNRAEEVRAIF